MQDTKHHDDRGAQQRRRARQRPFHGSRGGGGGGGLALKEGRETCAKTLLSSRSLSSIGAGCSLGAGFAFFFMILAVLIAETAFVAGVAR